VIEAKIISEMPLPIPRCVISSPSHITITQPAVSASTITNTLLNVRPPLTTSLPALLPNWRNRKT